MALTVILNLIQNLFDADERNETIAKFRKLLRNCKNSTNVTKCKNEFKTAETLL
jgi:hypothetical protein